MNKAEKFKVRRNWDWCGIPQVELEFEDGTVDSLSATLFRNKVESGLLIEVERWDDE